MPQRYALSLDHHDVAVRPSINCAPLAVLAPTSSRGRWQLEPFVTASTNTTTLDVQQPEAGTWLHAA